MSEAAAVAEVDADAVLTGMADNGSDPADGPKFTLELNQDQKDIREWVHGFAEGVVRPAAAEWDEREETPWPVIQEAAEIGLYSFEAMGQFWSDETGLTLPIANEELFWGDAGIGMAIMGTSLAVAAIFGQVLAILAGEGLIGREMFAIDGVKLPSNASKHRSGTRADLLARAGKLERVAATMLARHRNNDAQAEAPESRRIGERIERMTREAGKIRAWLADHPRDRTGPKGGVRKSNLTDNESAKLATDKCALALPLDRQRRQFARLGLDIPDKTLQSYWSYTADLIEPVASAVLSDVFASTIVGADDSHLRTLDRSSRNGSFRGHIWCFVGTDGTVGSQETVAYGYTPSWEASEIVEWFAAIDGFVQVDGYAGYSREVEDDDGQTLVAVPDERRLGCGMHIRSKFHRALAAKDRRAAIPLKRFADLYAIEEDCKTRCLDADARGEERRRRSLPLLDAFDDWVDAIHPKLLPKSPLRRATTYAIHQRPFFRRCFEDGRFEIDNGRTERRLRPYAVARRNFLFTGSARGGERLAAVFTLVDGCLILGIDPYLYLLDIIGKLESGWPLRRLSELMPARWALEHPGQQRPQ